MAKSAPFSIRLDPDLKAELQRLAERDRRSLNNFVEKVLAEYVARERVGGGKGQKGS